MEFLSFTRYVLLSGKVMDAEKEDAEKDLITKDGEAEYVSELVLIAT